MRKNFARNTEYKITEVFYFFNESTKKIEKLFLSVL